MESYDIGQLAQQILGGVGGGLSDSKDSETADVEADVTTEADPQAHPPSEHAAEAAAAVAAEQQWHFPFVHAFIAARVTELAGGRPAPEFGWLSRSEAARAVLDLSIDEDHHAALAHAAADCIPGLVAALGSQEQPVWSAALRLLSLASGLEVNSWAIAAAGGVEAVFQLVLAHSSDSTALIGASTVFYCLTRAPQLSQALVSGGGIAALTHGFRAASSEAGRHSCLLTLMELAGQNPSSSCTGQLLEAGVAPDVLQQMVSIESPYTATYVKSIVEQHGWSAALAIAEQAAESLLQAPMGTPLLPSSCRALAAALEELRQEGKQAGRPSGLARARQRRLQQLANRLKRAPAPADNPLSDVGTQSSGPPQPPNPTQLAAAQAAAEAAAAALMKEEQQQAEQKAAKVAAKAAKRQRAKERRQATEAAAAAADATAAASSAAAAEAEQPAEAADVAAQVAAPAAPAPAVHTEEAAAGEAQPEAPANSGSSNAAACASVGQGRRRHRKQKGKGAAASSAAAQEAAAGQVGSSAAAGQEATTAEGSPCSPAQPEAAELEQLMQQLGLGLAAAAEGSPAGGAVCAAAEAHVAAAAAPVTPLPATEIAAGQPAGGPTAAAAAAAVPPLPLDPTLLSDLCCPITHEPMSDPVVAADGTTYERAAIEGWIARQRAAGQVPTSPLTGAPLQDLSLRPNLTLRGLVASVRAAGLLQ